MEWKQSYESLGLLLSSIAASMSEPVRVSECEPSLDCSYDGGRVGLRSNGIALSMESSVSTRIPREASSSRVPSSSRELESHVTRMRYLIEHTVNTTSHHALEQHAAERIMTVK